MSPLEVVLDCHGIELFMEEEKRAAWDMHSFMIGVQCGSDIEIVVLTLSHWDNY